jgi:Protein of unknown function (DUF3570)
MDIIQNATPRPAESATFRTVGTALMTAALALPLIEPVHAESAPERGLIALKYLDYQDSQPDASRIKVQASALSILAPISGEWSLGGTLTTDSISGASPLYQSSAITPMHDHRRAVEGNVTRYFPNGTLSIGANVSSESDYLSRGLSLQATRSSEDKNTTWTAGLGYNSDVINPTNLAVVDATKQVTALLFGVTQVLTTDDIVQLNLTLSLGRGDFSDPYKFADSRPNTRDSNIVLLRWNHFLESTQGTARLSYRYYTDSWSIDSHTLGFEYVQPLPQGWTVTPQARLYSQSAASFYVNPDASSFPFAPNSIDNYSEDQRVSAFGAHTLGLKVTKQLDAGWILDMKYENYEQRASWRLFGSGSPSQVPFYARSIQLGLSHPF